MGEGARTHSTIAEVERQMQVTEVDDIGPVEASPASEEVRSWRRLTAREW